MEATARQRGEAGRVRAGTLTREPLSWAGTSAFVGAAVGLLGTLLNAALLSSPAGSMDPPSLFATLGPPLGGLLVALSLAGVPALLRGGPRAAIRVAWLLGGPLVALSLVFFLWQLLLQAGWLSLGDGWTSGELPPLVLAYSALNLCLPPATVAPFALAAFLGRRARLGALLIGVCVLTVSSLAVWQYAVGGVVGEVSRHIGAIALMGGFGAGVGLPEAALWALFGAVLLRAAGERARDKELRAREEANLRAARRLYERGLGEGDALVLEELLPEGFRGPGRSFSALRRSYPDLEVSVEGQEAEGDLVRTRLRLSGTDEGGAMWYPPTGKRVSFAAEFEDRFRDGLVVGHSGEADTEDLLRQLGHDER